MGIGGSLGGFLTVYLLNRDKLMTALIALCHARKLYKGAQTELGNNVCRHINGGIGGSPVVISRADKTEALVGDFQQTGDAFRLTHRNISAGLLLVLLMFVFVEVLFLRFVAVEGFPANLTATLAFSLGVFIAVALLAIAVVKMAALIGALLPWAVRVLFRCAHDLRKSMHSGKWSRRGYRPLIYLVV